MGERQRRLGVTPCRVEISAQPRGERSVAIDRPVASQDTAQDVAAAVRRQDRIERGGRARLAELRGQFRQQRRVRDGCRLERERGGAARQKR